MFGSTEAPEKRPSETYWGILTTAGAVLGCHNRSELHACCAPIAERTVATRAPMLNYTRPMAESHGAEPDLERYGYQRAKRKKEPP